METRAHLRSAPHRAPTLDLYRQERPDHGSMGTLKRRFKRKLPTMSVPLPSARYLQVKHYVLERIAGGRSSPASECPPRTSWCASWPFRA